MSVVKSAREILADIEASLEPDDIFRPAPNAATPDQQLTVDQIAAMWRVSRVTVYRWVNEGLIVPVGKRGRKRLFLESEVVAASSRLPPVAGTAALAAGGG